jgi:hypothetical protein
MTIDVPIQELMATTVFVRAKFLAGIRGIPMYVERQGPTCVARFETNIGHRKFGFQVAILFYELDDAKDVTRYLAARMSDAWRAYLSAADNHYIYDWASMKSLTEVR